MTLSKEIPAKSLRALSGNQGVFFCVTGHVEYKKLNDDQWLLVLAFNRFHKHVECLSQELQGKDKKVINSVSFQTKDATSLLKAAMS